MSESLTPPLPVLQQIRHNFFSQITAASQGYDSCLSFFRYRLQPPLLSQGVKFNVVSIGGSTLACAVCSLNRGQIITHQYHQQPLTLINQANDLFLQIDRQIDKQYPFLALSFAFPLEPVIRNGLLDGRLLRATKHHPLTGLIQKVIGQELETYFHQTYQQNIPVTCANDAVCLNLSAFGQGPQPVCGFIIGTGVNMSYCDGEEVINLESGNFNKFPLSGHVIAIDQTSTNQGSQLFEKAVAGGYLYMHFNHLAAGRGLDLRLHSTDELNSLAAGKTENPEVQLAGSIIESSASLAAAQLAGLWDYLYHRPVTCAAEGSVLLNCRNYRQYILNNLEKLSVPSDQINFVITPNSHIVGAARLAVGA
jgi:hexokinase